MLLYIFSFNFLGKNMENIYHSDRPEPANFSQYNKAAADVNSTESSFLFPWSLEDPHGASTSTNFQFCGLPLTSSFSMPIDGVMEDRAAAASKSHSLAEKRRRDRINAQLATLRKLIPKSDKMDKAALLGSVIEHVKDLKRKAVEVSEALIVPTEVDEVNIENTTSENTSMVYIRATVCCEDSPELFSELIQVLKGQRLSAVRAEVASVGGRVKSILVLCSNKDDGDDQNGQSKSVCINSLRNSLKLVLTKIGSSSHVSSHCRIRSKRQRFFLPSSHYSQ